MKKQNKQQTTGAQALVDSLAKAGTGVLFGYPGGQALDIFNCLPEAPFQFILGRHEQGCVHMADGYARATGKPGAGGKGQLKVKYVDKTDSFEVAADPVDFFVIAPVSAQKPKRYCNGVMTGRFASLTSFAKRAICVEVAMDSGW